MQIIFPHKDTVKDIDKRAIKEAHNSRNLDGIIVLWVDDIAIGKGHKSLNMIHFLDGPRGPELIHIIHIGKDRKEEDLELLWKRHLLNALNEVRNAEFKRARKKMRGLFCGKRFILLSRVADLSRDSRKTLKELLRVNKRLCKAHLLKDSFNQFWSHGSKRWALRFWEQWKWQIKWSRLEPYKRFTKMIDKHIEGVLTCCDKRVSSFYIEATNLKAKNIIQRAYVYRKIEYMKLKIIQGCYSLGVFEPWSFFDNSS